MVSPYLFCTHADAFWYTMVFFDIYRVHILLTVALRQLWPTILIFYMNLFANSDVDYSDKWKNIGKDLEIEIKKACLKNMARYE